MAYLIVGTGSGRSLLSDEEKVEAIAAIAEGDESAQEVVERLYKDKGKKVPKAHAMTVLNWKRSLQKKINNGHASLLELCQEKGIVREGPLPVPTPRKAPAKKAKK